MPSIVVLPFTDLSDDQRQGYFADGMVEELTTALSRIKWLLVIARNSSFTYKGRSVDIRQIGRDLDVRYVLEGSVRKVDRQVRIAVQLIDARTAGHLWADSRNCDLGDILAVQDQVASDVAGQIEPRLRSSEIERAVRKAPQIPDVYDLYLRALGAFHQHTPEGIREATVLLKRLRVMGPSYGPATALLCECRVTARLMKWEILSSEEITETIELAAESIRMGRDDPDMLWMGAISLAHFAEKNDEAALALERAIYLNPNSASAWNASGWVSLNKDRPGLAADAFRRALRLSPVDPMRGYFTCGLGLAELMMGNDDEAISWAKQSVSEMPRYVSAIRVLIAACSNLDRIYEARSWLERLLRIDPIPDAESLRASVAAYSQEAQELLVNGICKAGLPRGKIASRD